MTAAAEGVESVWVVVGVVGFVIGRAGIAVGRVVAATVAGVELYHGLCMFLEVKELGFGFAIGVPIILVGLPILLFAVLQLIKKDAY